jgi:5-oxoprolinase (ATP-hydrolysing) subunit A
VKRIDLNVDVGEGFAFDRALMAFATSLNIACGEHAGSWEITRETARLGQEQGLRLGAHPGFPDRESMGRAEPADPDAHLPSIREQIRRFEAEFEAAYVKPHGALYHLVVSGQMDARDWTALPLLLFPTPLTQSRYPNLIREGFADRGLGADGLLILRGQPGALLEDPAEFAAQVLRLAPQVDSLCLHGDGNHALEFAELVTRALRDNGFEIGIPG